MLKRCVVILDAGKTNAKLTLWDPDGRPLERRVRPNLIAQTPQYRALDTAGIESWLTETLVDYAKLADIGAIIPVGHGAAAALVRGDALFAAPLDYEQEIEVREREAYARQRDAFQVTGSPFLPQGLNLGLQLHHLEQLTGPWPEDLSIIPWPQYWAWRLCGTLASEVSSLGCHTDLWLPLQARYSDLAQRRGWARRLAPLRRAAEPLGCVTAAWAARTGIAKDCVVLCGLHDSNAALLAARGHPDIREHDATVLSTGTWFVAMRSPKSGVPLDLDALSDARDCLINVDVHGRATPSARFMGGREAQLIGGVDSHALIVNYEPDTLIERLPQVLAQGAAALPTFAPGFGPFPSAVAEWRSRPDDPGDQRAITGLYLALMADTCLQLVGSRDRLLIEGRFAEAVIFVRALAALRPQQQVFISNAHDDVPYGALRLLDPDLKPRSPLTAVAPLAVDFSAYARAWRLHASRGVT